MHGIVPSGTGGRGIGTHEIVKSEVLVSIVAPCFRCLAHIRGMSGHIAGALLWWLIGPVKVCVAWEAMNLDSRDIIIYIELLMPATSCGSPMHIVASEILVISYLKLEFVVVWSALPMHQHKLMVVGADLGGVRDRCVGVLLLDGICEEWGPNCTFL